MATICCSFTLIEFQVRWTSVTDILAPFTCSSTLSAQLIRHFVEDARRRGKKGVVLTCKDHMIPFYRRAGFVWQGVSASEHGGATWNDMLLIF